MYFMAVPKWISNNLLAKPFQRELVRFFLIEKLLWVFFAALEAFSGLPTSKWGFFAAVHGFSCAELLTLSATDSNSSWLKAHPRASDSAAMVLT